MPSTVIESTSGAHTEATPLQQVADTLHEILLGMPDARSTVDQAMLMTVRRLRTVPMSDIRYAITLGKSKGLFSLDGASNSIHAE